MQKFVLNRDNTVTEEGLRKGTHSILVTLSMAC